MRRSLGLLALVPLAFAAPVAVPFDIDSELVPRTPGFCLSPAFASPDFNVNSLSTNAPALEPLFGTCPPPLRVEQVHCQTSENSPQVSDVLFSALHLAVQHITPPQISPVQTFEGKCMQVGKLCTKLITRGSAAVAFCSPTIGDVMDCKDVAWMAHALVNACKSPGLGGLVGGIARVGARHVVVYNSSAPDL